MASRSSTLTEYSLLGSTQDNAKTWAHAHRGDDNRLQQSFWVRADEQNTGRGRQGRSWHQAAPGSSLLCSCAFFTQPTLLRQKSLLSLVAGWSIYQSCLADLPALKPILSLKWPNDLGHFSENGLFHKLAGVLVESPFPDAYIVGWGMNVAASPKEDRATSIADLRSAFFPSQTMPTLADCLQRLQKIFLQELEAWESHPVDYEKYLLRELTNGPMHQLWGREGFLANGQKAQATGLQSDGALRITLSASSQSPAREHIVYAGDFSFNPLPTPPSHSTI